MLRQYLADVPIISAFATMATSVLTYLPDYGGSVLDHLDLVVAVSHLSGDKPHVTISTNVALPKGLTSKWRRAQHEREWASSEKKSRSSYSMYQKVK